MGAGYATRVLDGSLLCKTGHVADTLESASSACFAGRAFRPCGTGLYSPGTASVACSALHLWKLGTLGGCLHVLQNVRLDPTTSLLLHKKPESPTRRISSGKHQSVSHHA